MISISYSHERQHRFACALDSALGHLVEIPAALLVLTEIVVLLAGVTSRYLLHAPLVWSMSSRRCCFCGSPCSAL